MDLSNKKVEIVSLFLCFFDLCNYSKCVLVHMRLTILGDIKYVTKWNKDIFRGTKWWSRDNK